MTRAYLDWAASAPLHPVARAAAMEAMEIIGNPSSVHAHGRAARALLERAREQVAAFVGCSPREIVFTASGTEANALAVVGGHGARGGRVAVSAIEHPSVALAARSLPEAEVVVLPCDAEGAIDLERAEALLAAGASLVAVQVANNETGVVQPWRELAGLAARTGAHLHFDAVQAAGKIPLEDIAARCHTLSLSAHKLGGLPGAGALVVRRGHEPAPIVSGHQERGLRGGTHALVPIAAFGAVVEHLHRHIEQRRARIEARSRELERILLAAAPDAVVHGRGAERVPGIVNVRFPGVDGETLLVALDLAGVSCSHGAACASGAMEPSPVLLAMGLEPAAARAAIRFSVGDSTTDEELAHLAKVLGPALEAARKAC